LVFKTLLIWPIFLILKFKGAIVKMVFKLSVCSRPTRLIEGITLLFLNLLFLGPDSTAQTSKEKSGEYATDPESVHKGQRLFDDNCSACHNFSQKSIGPSLGRAVNQSSKDWLRRFIKNPPEMIASKDVRATALFEEYKQVMPPFAHLEGDELEAR
jgi:mono/diheme cytochrome c family protein